MADQPKTRPTDVDVTDYIARVQPERRRSEAVLLVDLMSAETGERPVLWGPSMIGFGHHRMTYASGRTVESFRVGFAPRKAQTVVYVGGGFDLYQDLLPRLGRHSTGKACLYLRDVAAADQDALRDLVRRSYAWEPAA
ncbi:MAG TPA: DUF1801 domain-containing protein [Nakamurella sp.]|jgi:hypothetical protein